MICGRVTLPGLTRPVLGVSVLDRFLPPPGAPRAVRVGAACCRDVVARLQELADHVEHRAAVLSSTWSGSAKEAFVAQAWAFFHSVGASAAQLRQLAQGLDDLADGIDSAQNEYHQRMAAVVATGVVGGILTVVTLTASDEAAAAAITAELATATELATAATAEAASLFTTLAAQAAQLALRAAVLTGVTVATDAVSGMVSHRDLDPFTHLHLADDVEFGLIGAVAAPANAGLLTLAGRVGERALLQGAGRVATPLLTDGISWISADVAVREATRQGVDPGELAFLGLSALAGGSARVAAGRLKPTGGRPLAAEAPPAPPPISFSYPRPAMVVPPDGGELLPGVPTGAVGLPVRSGKGLKYQLPETTPGVDARVRWIRVMDPTQDGPYPHPQGYVNYMNDKGQAVDPRTGKTIRTEDPLWHIELPAT